MSYSKIHTPNGELFLVSTVGYSHLKTNKPCQDSSMITSNSFKGYTYNILAVSDGHGSSQYTHSEYGSNFAVQAAQDCANQFIINFISNMEEESQTEQSEDNSDSKSKINEEAVINNFKINFKDNFGKMLVKEWRAKVELFINNCSNNEELTYTNFGATVTVGIIFKDIFFSGSIGDCSTFVISNKENSIKTANSNNENGGETTNIDVDQFDLYKNDELIGEETYSLCSDDASNNWATQISTINLPDLGMVVMATDGFEKSYNHPKDILANTFYKLARTKGIDALYDSLTNKIEEITRKGSQDDISIIIFYPCSCQQADCLEEENIINEKD